MSVKSCEKIEKSQVVLTIEVGAPEFEAAIEKAYQKMRKKINVPGFRPGKAPRHRQKEQRSGIYPQKRDESHQRSHRLYRTALRIVSRRITFGIDFTLPSLIRKADPPLFDVVGITFPIDSQVNMAVPKSNDRSLCDIGAFPVEREIANRQSFALLSQEKHQTPVCDEFSATAVDY